MVAHQGRPHWGKLHFRTVEDLPTVYPQWDDFQAVRRRVDPDGVFQNLYVRRVLGPLIALFELGRGRLSAGIQCGVGRRRAPRRGRRVGPRRSLDRTTP